MTEGERQIAEQKIRNIIKEVACCEDDKITPEADFRHDLDVDSLDAVEIIMNIEKEFGIDVPDDVVEKLSNLKQITDYLESRNIIPK